MMPEDSVVDVVDVVDEIPMQAVEPLNGFLKTRYAEKLGYP